MVFESVVAELLNRFLGDYVENLDRSQLKIGIWGGDVVLQDLSLKQSALDELDLPVKTVYGHLGKLVLKIPWKNLYSAPVEASVERLFLLVVPNQSVKYDAAKEEKYLQELKQAELQRVEDAKKREKEKGQPKAADSFVEKLATQIIKNVQVKIKDIHIRYEDRVTNPEKPFSVGITLHNLSVHTTDDQWKACIVQEAATKIHKVLELEGLAVYWNCCTNFFPTDNSVELLQVFQNNISTKDHIPTGFIYMLGPINSSARLQLNPKPENDESNFKIPKVLLNLTLEKLAVGLSKDQYHDLIELLESFDRMSQAALYRKYRPQVPYKSHAKEWWKFAYVCILEEEVRRKRRNWDWQHMARHRMLCREYAAVYYNKLTTRKLAPDVQEKLAQGEKILDVLNIVLIRKKIEMEVERMEAKLQQESKHNRGWFSGWFGGSSPAQDEAMSAAAIVRKLEDAMTSDEKGKLYRAIDYQENAAPTQYPTTFVEMVLNFTLKSLTIEVRDDSYSVPRVLYTELQGVVSSVEQRPSAQAMKVVAKINEFTVFGLKQEDLIPKLVSSKALKEGVLLDVLFETKPLDEKCDQRVHVSSRPVQIVYDAQTINKLVDVFRAPKSNALSQLQAAAESRLTDFKEMSATGLQYAIEHQKVLDLKVNLSASYILVPYSGFYNRKEDVLVINLGNFSMMSIPRDLSQQVNVRQLYSLGTSEEEILRIMSSRSYDKFTIELKDMQVLVALAGEDWKAALVKKKASPMHLLLPTSLIVNLEKCLIIDDPRLPKMKVAAHLPSVSVNLEDERLIHLLALFLSIPFPSEPDVDMHPLLDSGSRTSSISLLSHHMDIAVDRKKSRGKVVVKCDDPNVVQAIELQLNFEMRELTLVIFRHEMLGIADKVLDFRVLRLELEMQQQTFDMDVTLRLGGIAMTQNYLSTDIKVLDCPMAAGGAEYMFIVKYIKVDKKSPEFHSKHGSVEQLVLADFTRLSVLLHQEALVQLLEYVTSFSSQLEEVKKENSTLERVASIRPNRALSTIVEEGGSLLDSRKVGGPRKRGSRMSVTESINLKLKATVHKFNVELTNHKMSLANLSLEGVAVGFTVKKSCTEVIARLKNLTVLDPNPATYHEKILSIMGDEAMSAEVVMFNLNENSSPDSVDMSVRAQMACIRVVFLNWFVTTLLTFLNSFQTAQKAIVDAATEAAEAARHNVKAAYAKATRMSLAIDLKAPLIVIPVNSTSMDVIFLDLGNLMIKNKFETLLVHNEAGHAAVIDIIQLELQNLKLSRVKLGSEDELINECMLLEPISFTLEVKRNLSTGWYQQVPDIDMSGRLKEVQVTLSQEDYRMIMQVTKENLSEGSHAPVATTSTPQLSWNVSTQSFVDRPKTLDGLQTISVMSVETKKAVLPPKPNQVTTSVKFTFTMDSLIIDLFIGGSKNLDGVSSPMRLPQNGLARISLHVLSLKGHMYSDGTLSTSVLLVDCLLDDTRHGRENKLTRLMERKPEPSLSGTLLDQITLEQTFRSMVDVTFQQKGSDMFVDVRIFSFNLILCLDYLMKVADFFTGVPDTTSLSPPALASKSTHLSIKTGPSTSGFSHSKVTVVKEPAQSMMTVNVRVEKPDIILVESMDDINTNALVLNNEVIFKLRMSNDHQVMTGSIKDLQLYTCCYNPKKRGDTVSQILLPCSISLAGSTPPGEGLHLELCVTDIRLRVSPATIELLSKVHRAMVMSQDEEGESITKEEDYSDIWQTKAFTDTDYWYLKTEVAEEAGPVVVPVEPVVKGEICILSAPSIVVTVEAGVGNQTLPMILLELSFQGAVNNWSSQLYVETSMSVQMAYYNSVLALWEPLIEPVETVEDGQIIRCPWELKAEIQMNKQEETVGSPISSSEDVEDLPYQPPAITIEVSSKDNLELTMTKTCIDVLSNLGKAFQTAFHEGLAARVGPVAPYLVQNDTGLAIALLLENGTFQVQDRSENKEDYSQVMLESGAKVGLFVQEEKTVANIKSTAAMDQVQERFLQIKVIERNCTLELPVTRADKRYFSLKHRGEGNDPWGLVSHVQVADGGTIITLRSILQVHNDFNEPVDVYYMTKRGNEVECIGTVGSKEQINLPLYSVYTPTNELFFSVQGFTVSVVPFVWKQLQNQLASSKMLQCEPKDSSKNEPFFMKIVGELEQVYFENTTRHTMVSTCYNIHLRPAVVIKNFLPIDLVCCLFGTAIETALEAGQCIQIPTAEPSNSSIVLRISDYLEKEWSCKHEVQVNAPEFAVWTFDSHDSVHKVSLDLGMHTIIKNGSIVMSLYCPFWMLNKTGMMLSYRKSRRTEKNEASGSPMKRWASNLSLTGKPTVQSDDTANVLYHPEDFKGPILFSFRAKSFFGKKKACVKIEDGEWSDKFSLDVAGSSGVVNCKSAGVTYKVGVHIQLTYSTLTKQVTFTPYYVLINNSHCLIECQEADRPADPWMQVQPDSCCALWPLSSEEKHLRARVVGTSEMTAAFSYDTIHTTLLRLDNKYGGMNVDIQMTEGAVYITFTSYEPGLAPVLIMNHTDVSIPFSETGSDQIWILGPKQCELYTWANPLGPRQLIWTSHKKKEIIDDLRKDGIGEFSPQADVNVYWVSFLDGMQRVLLFTYDMAIARDAQSAGELEALQQEITVSIYGVGLSLVNDLTRTELLYIGIASSGVIWEVRKMNQKRFKPLSVADCKAIEEAFERYKRELLIGNAAKGHVQVDNKIEVDFENEEMIKPNKRHLRRTFLTGLWLQMKTSPHQLQLHAKVNRLQIDNQMYDCVFPVILAPVPPPKSMAADNALKPFAELSVVQRVMEHSPVQQYKYFKVLIQEFHVKVDIGFVNALLQMFETEQSSDAVEAQQFEQDRKLVDEPLLAHVSLQSSQEQKNFYDLLHFSPLKIHLSFSLSGGGQGLKAGQDTPRFLNVLLQSLGVTLTDIQDVVFKLAYFERQYSFLTQRQLMSEATMHYVGQSLKQLYVLVLGLDVLGNPYGLVLGFTQGVEDLFYEPFQGAIQGPGEFAEGLVLGVRSLFGHTVGGAAGAVSRITGAMGKGIAALTFDKDYQRKRREAMNQRPANVQMGLAQSGKGLVMGVVDGVSGVFLKPISGAREEGVEGFFKGMGKGVVGLVTRPTAGVIDFASGSFGAVKRAAEMSDEIIRLRPPRFFQQDGLVRPYVRLEAEGNKLLQELEKGRYASTDIYVFHMEPVPGGKDVLLLTDKRVMYIVHNDIFGGWQVDWDYTWETLSVEPTVVEKGIFITTGEPRKKVLGLFGSGEKSGKVVLIKDLELKEWIANKMVELMKR